MNKNVGIALLVIAMALFGMGVMTDYEVGWFWAGLVVALISVFWHAGTWKKPPAK